MAPRPQAFCRWFPVFLAFAFPAAAGHAAFAPGWQERHDQIVARMRTLRAREGAFGPAYEPLYRAAIGWYEEWGGQNDDPVDANMVSPEQYASELADALEHGENFFADHPGALFPLAFEEVLPNGREVRCNYWLSLPAGFPNPARKFPLLVGLHGSGWLGHKISFVRGRAASGSMFGVTPIDQAGPWQLDFLNAYLDELERILPVDKDRVYVEGHSLGAMATWEWAMNNPERFAAISPRDGVGEPYRAIRLKNVPAWVIHGEKDDVIYSGYAEEMISAIRACGGTARYSLLPGAQHNLPPNFDQAPVTAWYLQHVRSHVPPAPDPRDALGLNDAGSSPWQVVLVPRQWYWRTGLIDAPTGRSYTRQAERPLFEKIQSRGILVDRPVRGLFDHSETKLTLWLAVPPALEADAAKDPSAVAGTAHRVARLYFRGTVADGLRRAEAVGAELRGRGETVSGRVWVTPLSLWQNTPRGICEYWVELD